MGTPYSSWRVALFPLVSVLAFGVLIAAQPDTPLRFARAPLSADDLAGIYGLDIYKFDLHAAGSHMYRIVLREKRAKDQPWKNLFAEKIGASDHPETTLMVSFTRTDGQFGGVLLRDQEEMDFSVKLCDPMRCYAGMSTTLPVPLAGCEGVVLFVHNSEAETSDAEPDMVRLLTVKPSSRLATQSGDAQHPRAELLLERIP